MKLVLNQEDIKSLIKKYYESKNQIVEVSLNATISYVGLYEDKTARANIVVKKSVDLLGLKKEMEETLSKDEVLGILNEVLNSAGYQVKDIRYVAGINEGGSYIWEGSGSQAYFSGIDLEIEKVNEAKRTLMT